MAFIFYDLEKKSIFPKIGANLREIRRNKYFAYIITRALLMLVIVELNLPFSLPDREEHK